MDSTESKGMGRREFIGSAAAALFAGVAITLIGCSEDDPAGPANGNMAGTVESVGGHTHGVTITKAQIDAAGAVTLTMTSTGGHTHDVELTAAQVTAIKNKQGVHNAVSTTTNSHSHGIMFM